MVFLRVRKLVAACRWKSGPGSCQEARVAGWRFRLWFAGMEEAGLAVQLVSSSQARNLPGRPKTDKEDARWIARLTEMGMLRSSFVPPPEIRALAEVVISWSDRPRT